MHVRLDLVIILRYILLNMSSLYRFTVCRNVGVGRKLLCSSTKLRASFKENEAFYNCTSFLLSNNEKRTWMPRATSSSLYIQQKRKYHVSRHKDSALIVGGLGLMAVAVGLQYSMDTYKNYKSNNSSSGGEGDGGKDAEKGKENEGERDSTHAAAQDAEVNSERATRSTGSTSSSTKSSYTASERGEKDGGASSSSSSASSTSEQTARKQKSEQSAATGDKTNETDKFMDELFGSSWSSLKEKWSAKNFYEGGFEEKMSRREAALILGVRENTTLERIKDAHRKVLLLNHPDRGGSALLAAKINEAKDVLLKTKQ